MVPQVVRFMILVSQGLFRVACSIVSALKANVGIGEEVEQHGCFVDQLLPLYFRPSVQVVKQKGSINVTQFVRLATILLRCTPG